MDAAQINALVTAAAQAALNNPPAAPAVPFARSPGQALANQVDYSSAAGAKLYAKNTAPLTTPFSLSEPNLRVLIAELETRSKSANWDDALKVDVNHAGAGPADERSLLTDHGRLSLEQCQTYSATYLFTETRKAQDNFQIYMCLSSSIDSETTKTMANESEHFMIQDPNDADNREPCGICFLKLLMSKAELDTRALASLVRNRLTELDTYMIQVAKNNIREFNEYVRDELRMLSSRGEETSDIITNLFKGYKACEDEKFVAYIEKLQEEYDDGSDLTKETLMTKAEKKYDTRTLNKEWNRRNRMERP